MLSVTGYAFSEAIGQPVDTVILARFQTKFASA
jgi:hypothetical protein